MLWAYFFLVLVCLSWLFHAKAMRADFLQEHRRMGHEKSALQNQLSNVTLKSSKLP